MYISFSFGHITVWALPSSRIAGIGPTKKLYERLRDLIWLRFPSSRWISPCSMFADRSMPCVTPNSDYMCRDPLWWQRWTLLSHIKSRYTYIHRLSQIFDRLCHLWKRDHQYMLAINLKACYGTNQLSSSTWVCNFFWVICPSNLFPPNESSLMLSRKCTQWRLPMNWLCLISKAIRLDVFK